MEKEEFPRSEELHLLLNHLNSENFWRIIMWINFMWKKRDGSCFTLISIGRNASSSAPNTHWRRKLFMPDCDAPFCHYSISEGHSFTITVGL